MSLFRVLSSIAAPAERQPDRDNDKYINSQTHPEQNVHNASFRVRLFGNGEDFKKGRRAKPVSKRNVWNSNCLWASLCSTFSRPNPIAILKSFLIRTDTHVHTQRIKRPNTPIGDERKVLKTKRQCVAANFAVLLRRRRTLSWLSEREMSMAAANSPASISILYRKKSKEQRHISRTAATETLSSYNVWCLCYLRVQNFPQNVIYHTRGTIHKHT